MEGMWWAFIVLIALPQVPGCSISEFTCRNGRCVSPDAYCDGVNDCGDESDEPRQCTVCNRTYYGDVGKTYMLVLPKPREERLPFLCHLTFTANGRSFGQLVQLIFDAFHVGRYEGTALDGCPDGHMQLLELGRPFTGGSWCGAAKGFAVYYSETSTVTVTLRIYHSAAPFEFKLRYKYVGEDEAVVRFGSVTTPFERGEVVPGTYCSRNFYECYRKRCRLQSPNYPGMYPRNVTCYLTLRQKTVPTCKHAMIAVKQESSHKMQIKRAITQVPLANLNKTIKELRAWTDCTGERDHLIFYDGDSTNDPVLVKYCGGDWLPQIVSRGPHMLVAFHSSPFSVPLHSESAPSPLRGFELDVDVLFSDSDSFDYSRDSRKCEFWINATDPDITDPKGRLRGRAGAILSPRHTLPPNTTCMYRFHGQPTDQVWIYFSSYSHHSLIANSSHNCSTRLRIWDGGGIQLGNHCDAPKLCDHTSLRNSTRITRPCRPDESYVTRTNSLTVQHHTDEGTALHPTNFRIRYEFVDTRLGGDPWMGRRGEDPPPQPCSRVFRRIKSGVIRSPKNIFFYGRGGAKNLSCLFRIESGPGEKIRLTLHNASFGENFDCSTEIDIHTGRSICVRNSGGYDRLINTAELFVYEVPWKDVRVAKGCYCDNTTLSPGNGHPITFISSSRVFEITLTISHFNISEDFNDIYFHASFELQRGPECPRKQRVRGSGGEIELISPPKVRADIYCDGLPWLVEAHENRSLFLLTWGHFLPVQPSTDDTSSCATKNRVLLYTGRPIRLLKVVCPATPKERQYAVHIFSEEWWGSSSGGEIFLRPPRPPSFLLEFIGRESGVAALNWLEISRSKSSLLQQLVDYGDATPEAVNETMGSDWECPHRCPELNACISSSLWCDGRTNCPSGYDEAENHCGGVGRHLLAYLPTYAVLGGVAAGVAAFCILIGLLIVHRLRLQQRRRRRLGKDRNSTGPHRVPTEEMLLDPSSSTTSS